MRLPLFLSRSAGLLVALLALNPTAVRAEDPAPPAPAADTAPSKAVENSVVKIFATMRYPDPFKPWTKQAPRDSTGTGVIIEGNRILTNAHVALYASQIQVQANESGDKLPATLEFIAPGIDLAVLKLEDESFFANRPPLPRSRTVPSVKDTVMVYGFPTGGSNLSITKGIVSRIEFALYNYPVGGLRIQIDAAINPGNSGGPALSGDQMIGLAFSRLGGADNIGYIIPCEEIDLFLQDITDGRYDGKPAMFDQLQTLENPALRAYLGLDKSTEGIVVQAPESTDEAYPLKMWDLITRIGDVPVDNEGMIKLGTGLRVRFQYLIQQLAREGTVPLTIVRAKQSRDIRLPVSPNRPMLIENLEGSYPPFFILGPLAFTPATALYVAPVSNNAKALSSLSFLGSPLITRRGEKPSFPGEELVLVAAPSFPHKLVKGYDNAVSRAVRTVNGVPIRNLRHLVEVVRDNRDEFLVFEFFGMGETMIFPRKEMIDSTEDILSDNGVRDQATPELLEVWKAKPAQ
ncbi:serine protease [Oleiharenicola lentus]|jgi:S1-C subfamily serine protease|uniref:Serine protease n=1 Tax=Oleiharenicola lentus TaxID=2508720 RepID=A0A4Q1C7P1_9BACT|nr:S1C family serine protease [Oleiharenicola lentus]RXK54935.1 serine protease [Oleiharenicola lentus]